MGFKCCCLLERIVRRGEKSGDRTLSRPKIGGRIEVKMINGKLKKYQD